MSNLNSKQFYKATDDEAKQLRRFGRRHEPGYTGAGFNYLGYPFMTNATIMGAGSATSETEPNETLGQEQSEHASGSDQDAGMGQTADADDTLGFGGTTTGMMGTS